MADSRVFTSLLRSHAFVWKRTFRKTELCFRLVEAEEVVMMVIPCRSYERSVYLFFFLFNSLTCNSLFFLYCNLASSRSRPFQHLNLTFKKKNILLLPEARSHELTLFDLMLRKSLFLWCLEHWLVVRWVFFFFILVVRGRSVVLCSICSWNSTAAFGVLWFQLSILMWNCGRGDLGIGRLC